MFTPIWCFFGLVTVFRLRLSICTYPQTFEISPLNLGKVFFLHKLLIFFYILWRTILILKVIFLHVFSISSMICIFINVVNCLYHVFHFYVVLYFVYCILKS